MFLRPLLLLAAVSVSVSSVRGLKVAVIGGGVGGTASAYYLRQLLKQSLEVHVFEANELGGRLATMTVGGREYEAGGSIIHPRNKHVRDLVKELGLEERKPPQEDMTSLYDGENVVFEESGWSLWDLAKMGFRYGPLSLYRAHNQLQRMLADFEKIYDAQAKGQSFRRVSDLLAAMSPSFVNLTSSSAAELDGVSKEFIAEVIGAVLRVNYGQWPKEATQFVAFVSLAAAEGGLWSVKGGNRLLPKALLAASGATLRPHRIEAVAQIPGGGFNLSWAKEEETYDAVVVATPFVEGGLKMPVAVERRPMEGIWVTLAEADGPNPTFFGGRVLQDVVSVGPTWFNCLAKVHPVNDPSPDPSARHVYKIFSGAKPSQEQLEMILAGVGEVKQRHFWAYPHYEWARNPDGAFQLLPGLVHTNALEWAASAIEMSAIAAKNAALSLVTQFYDSPATSHTGKDEL